MKTRLALTLALSGALALPTAALAQGPPPPTAVNGKAVQTVAPAGSIPSPVAFAFGAGKVFVASGGAEDGSASGGIFVAGGGKATLVPDSPKIVFGLVWHKGVLYVSGDQKLLSYSGWNGTRFTKIKTLFKGPKNFSGFGGLSWHEGRIYAGVAISNFKYDSRKSPQPYAQSVVSLKPNGKDLRVIARGLREPWQMTFVKGIDDPFVSVLGQDNINPPDYIIRARSGQDYGFPKCSWLKPKPCKPYAKPYLLLPPHSSPMGIGSIGKRIYVALFGKQQVATFKVGAAKKPRPFLTGYAAPITGLGIHHGWIYTSDLTGSVYRVKS